MMKDLNKPVLRFRFQYSLRTLIVLSLVFSLACSYLATKMHSARTQESAVAELRKAGFQVLYDDQVDEQWRRITDGNWRRSGFLCNLFGDDFVATVIKASAPWGGGGSLKLVFYSDADDKSVAPLRNLPHLRYVALDYSQVTDAGIDSIRGLMEVRVLGLAETKITDRGLARLCGMTHLRDLRISCTQVTDGGLRHLRLFRELKTLTVGGEKITDRGLAELANLHGLQELDIETRFNGDQKPDGTFPTTISDEAVESLRRALPNCSITVHTDYL